MIYRYRVRGTDDYTIRIDRQADGTYKLFALSYPPDPYRKGVSDNHLFSGGQICVAAKDTPRTLERARAIAMFWCEGWSVYVRTGTFPNRARKVVV